MLRKKKKKQLKKLKKKTKNKGMYNIHVYMIDGTGTQYNVAQDMVKLE